MRKHHLCFEKKDTTSCWVDGIFHAFDDHVEDFAEAPGTSHQEVQGQRQEAGMLALKTPNSSSHTRICLYVGNDKPEEFGKYQLFSAFWEEMRSEPQHWSLTAERFNLEFRTKIQIFFFFLLNYQSKVTGFKNSLLHCHLLSTEMNLFENCRNCVKIW